MNNELEGKLKAGEREEDHPPDETRGWMVLGSWRLKVCLCESHDTHRTGTAAGTVPMSSAVGSRVVIVYHILAE